MKGYVFKGLVAILFLLIGLDISYATQSFDFKCPDWFSAQNSNLPVCPEGGLVPENYPMAAIVLTGQEGGKSDPDRLFVPRLVRKILAASGEKNPLLILPDSEEIYKNVIVEIDSMDVSVENKIKFKKSIVRSNNTHAWQQDYMQPFFDPDTGQIILREVEGYANISKFINVAEGVKSIVDSTKKCGVAEGPKLKTGGLASGGHFGGNIEVLPGGICLLGDDNLGKGGKWDNYADQICQKGSENRIKVPTSWLTVGHTDEIMKVVPNRSLKSPCDFSIALASPDKAIQLLRENPTGKFINIANNLADYNINGMLMASAAFYDLCSAYLQVKTKKNKQPNDKRRSKKTSRLLDIKAWLFQEAHASGFLREGQDQVTCADMTNEEALKLFTKDKNISRYNQLVQKNMNILQDEIKLKMKRKFPMCEIDFISLPGLFGGGKPVSKNKTELPRQMGLSYLPNVTNTISVGSTVISPDPSNDAFRKYIEGEYRKRGLTADFLDTFGYSHVRQGNLHCLTNPIYVCSPRGKR